jgi:predicted nucleotidyltransferase
MNPQDTLPSKTWTAAQIMAFLDENRATLRQMGVEKIGLFGSYARGEQKEGSDIDFLVRLGSSRYQDYLNLRRFLEAAFACSIDLGEEDYLREEIAAQVLKEVLYVQGL